MHYQYKGRDDSSGFNRSQLMQLTIAALPRGSDVMWCVLAGAQQHQPTALPGCQPLLAIAHSACDSRWSRWQWVPALSSSWLCVADWSAVLLLHNAGCTLR